MSIQTPETLRNWLSSLPSRLNEPWLAMTTSLGSLTGGQLVRLSLQISARLATAGITRGSRVATVLPPDLDLAVNLALMHLGAVSYSIPKGLRVTRGEYGVHTLISARRNETWGEQGQIVLDPLWLLEVSGITKFPDPIVFGKDEPCRLVVTSGSTGTPKAMLLSFGEVENRLFQGRSAAAPRGKEISFVSTAGWYGFKTALEGLISETTSYSFSVDSVTFADDLIASEVETITGSPTQLAALLRLLGAKAPRLWTLKRINCVGGKLPVELFRSLKEAFGCDIYIRYSSTETANVASGLFDPDAPEGSVGLIREGTVVEIVSDEGQPLPHGSEGLIRVKNNELVTNYIKPDGTEIPALIGGWFYTGDIGFMDEHGGLIVRGRAGSTINVGGVKLNLSVIEDRLRDLPGVSDAVAFVLPEQMLGVDRLAVALEVTPDFSEDVAVTRIRELNLGVNLEQIHTLSQFPRSAVGKVMKSTLLEKLKAIPPRTN